MWPDCKWNNWQIKSHERPLESRLIAIIHALSNMSKYFWQACVHIYSLSEHCETVHRGEHCLQLYRQVDTRRQWLITIMSLAQETTIALPIVIVLMKYVSFVSVMYIIWTCVRSPRNPAGLIRLWVRSIGFTQSRGVTVILSTPPYLTRRLMAYWFRRVVGFVCAINTNMVTWCQHPGEDTCRARDFKMLVRDRAYRISRFLHLFVHDYVMIWRRFQNYWHLVGNPQGWPFMSLRC